MQNGQLSAIIVDDEGISVNVLKNLIQKHIPEVGMVATTSSPDHAMELIFKHNPDIVFLDIDMPGKNGLEIASDMRFNKLKSTIIFVTSHDEYAIEAFRYMAFDYLVKPVQIKALKACISRLLDTDRPQALKRSLEQVMQFLNRKKILFRTLSGSIFISPDCIVYCQAEGNYTELILCDDTQQMVSMRLGEVEQLLMGKNFQRISRSVMVNEDYLHRIIRKDKKCILKSDLKEYELEIKGAYKRLWQ